MSINIKSEEAEELARSLSRETGESLTGAITVALRERLERVRNVAGKERAQRIRHLRAIAKDAGQRWAPEYQTADHADLLYDEKGLPR
jgi:antitoxin VapB